MRNVSAATARAGLRPCRRCQADGPAQDRRGKQSSEPKRVDHVTPLASRAAALVAGAMMSSSAAASSLATWMRCRAPLRNSRSLRRLSMSLPPRRRRRTQTIATRAGCQLGLRDQRTSKELFIDLIIKAPLVRSVLFPDSRAVNSGDKRMGAEFAILLQFCCGSLGRIPSTGRGPQAL